MKAFGIVAGVLAAVMTAQASQWHTAAPGRAIVLPADHASHPGYKIEWWYYTGNLDAAGAGPFGYQLTFFRVGVDPSPANRSLWAVRDLFMTHLALTDVSGRRFYFTDRVNRAGPGWAGAATEGYRVWNDDWEAALEPPDVHHLRAATHDFGIDLRLGERRPPVLHGDRGYSQKGSAPGDASYYYSLTRMPTTGTITVGGRALAVTGQSWMDHEFGTTLLESGQTGWDWFSLQLDDGRDLMLFQIRRADGTIDPHSSGTLVDPDGHTTTVAVERQFHLEPGRRWRSPTSGATYPVEWAVTLPGADTTLTVGAALDDQELHTEQSTGVTYWEGAVTVRGRDRGRAVTGRGYLEMTGYAGPSMSRIIP